MNESELKTIYQAITEAWKLIKKYSELKDDEEYWHRCILDLTEIESKSYAGEQFGVAAMNILEHCYREKLEEGKHETSNQTN